MVLGKYGYVMATGMQNTLAYRVNFLFRSGFGLIPLAATIFLWRAVFAGREGGGEVAGYTLAQMTSYYLVLAVVDMLTAVTDDDWQIAADIREGAINQFLLKPIDYLWYRFSLFLAGRAMYTAVALIPVGLCIVLLRDYVVLPPDAATVGWFLAALVLTGFLQFLISFTMALLSFWVLEVSTFIFILFAFEYVAGGHLFPLDILPPMITQLLLLTPFPYQLYFPVGIYLGRIQGDALWQGFAVQIAWIVLAYLLARFVWSRGIRRYAAFGG
jgi:ABC-2 type transport system permease protein